jgi:hypothetical protein
MGSQLENDRVLNTYFLSSLVGHSAKLRSIVVVPQNILSKKCDFGFARYLPREQKEFAQLGEMRFKNNI